MAATMIIHGRGRQVRDQPDHVGPCAPADDEPRSAGDGQPSSQRGRNRVETMTQPRPGEATERHPAVGEHGLSLVEGVSGDLGVEVIGAESDSALVPDPGQAQGNEQHAQPIAIVDRQGASPSARRNSVVNEPAKQTNSTNETVKRSGPDVRCGDRNSGAPALESGSSRVPSTALKNRTTVASPATPVTLPRRCQTTVAEVGAAIVMGVSSSGAGAGFAGRRSDQVAGCVGTIGGRPARGSGGRWKRRRLGRRRDCRRGAPVAAR